MLRPGMLSTMIAAMVDGPVAKMGQFTGLVAIVGQLHRVKYTLICMFDMTVDLCLASCCCLECPLGFCGINITTQVGFACF